MSSALEEQAQMRMQLEMALAQATQLATERAERAEDMAGIARALEHVNQQQVGAGQARGERAPSPGLLWW